MRNGEIFERIRKAIESAPRNSYVAELHIQCIKYGEALDRVSGREFCEGVGLKPAWGTEFAKMKKIWPRLVKANLDRDMI